MIKFCDFFCSTYVEGMSRAIHIYIFFLYECINKLEKLKMGREVICQFAQTCPYMTQDDAMQRNELPIRSLQDKFGLWIQGEFSNKYKLMVGVAGAVNIYCMWFDTRKDGYIKMFIAVVLSNIAICYYMTLGIYHMLMWILLIFSMTCVHERQCCQHRINHADIHCFPNAMVLIFNIVYNKIII